VIEVFLVVLISVWVGKEVGALSGGLASSAFSVFFSVGLFKNKALVGAVLISFVVAATAVYLPGMNRLFGTAPIKLSEFLTFLLLSSIGFMYLEISKSVRSRRLHHDITSVSRLC
jgi:magnesium-transporting ATPase (P-type)